MKITRLLIAVVATGVLALASAVPVAGSTPSCVGWFASTFARADAQAFAAEISGLAHEARPFGRTTVAPFAHIPLEFCQDAE